MIDAQVAIIIACEQDAYHRARALKWLMILNPQRSIAAGGRTFLMQRRPNSPQFRNVRIAPRDSNAL
jgi:hypothetical protein